ncbi:MAG: hypothetical protein IJM44_02235 [Ruminococcus sp.]|nr:hypothetical protein [Ruminococcus sp.]
MIVLKILLWILLAVLGLIVLVLVLPVSAEASYIGGKLSYKVKYWFINVMDSGGGGVMGWLKKRREKPKKPKKPKPPRADKKRKKKDEPAELLPAELPPEEALPAVQDDSAASQEAPETAAEALPADEPDTDADDLFPDGAEDEDTGKKKKKKKDKPSSSDDDGEEEKKPLSEKLEFIVGIWEQAQRPLLKIFKGFHFDDVFIDFIIADDDAHKCALSYGKMCAAVYNGLAQLSELFTVRLKTVDVNAGFALDDSRWDAGAKLKFRPCTVVIAGLWFLITYIFKVFIPDRLRRRKTRKAAEKLNKTSREAEVR